MDTKRIKMGHQRGEVAPNTFPDFNWIREHEDELLEKYGERVILVFNQQVLGVGDTIQEAALDAERNLPDEIAQATPVLEFLHHRQPFYRVRPMLKGE